MTTRNTEQKQADALIDRAIRSMSDADLRAEYINATRPERLFDSVSQAIRMECRTVAQRRGLDLERARS